MIPFRTVSSLSPRPIIKFERSEINDKSTILNYPPTSMKDFVSHLASTANLADLFLPEPLLFYEQFAREGYSGRR